LSVPVSSKFSGFRTCFPSNKAALNKSANLSLSCQKSFKITSGFTLFRFFVFVSPFSFSRQQIKRENLFLPAFYIFIWKSENFISTFYVSVRKREFSRILLFILPFFVVLHFENARKI